MGRTTAVTHADVAPRRRIGSTTAELGSKTGVLLTILCILCGLLCFVLCLIAEATRSEVTWVSSSGTGDDDGEEVSSKSHSTTGGRSSKYEYKCEYSGSGKTPLVCATTALVGMAGAMLLQHSFMLVAITNTQPPTFISWEESATNPVKSLTRQAAAFFASTWVCFAVAEIMLLIGLSVESGHLKNWSAPRETCPVIREGMFTAAGVFSLVAVFLAAGLYVSALRIQWLCQEEESTRREVMEVASSAIYLSTASTWSPPISPSHHPPPPPPTPPGSTAAAGITIPSTNSVQSKLWSGGIV